MLTLRLWSLAGAAVLVLLASSGADAASALPGNEFPHVERIYYLTGEEADSGSLALSEEPGAAGRQTFLAPGVDVLGLVQTPNTQSWTTDLGWDKDLEAVDDAIAILYFTANPQGLAVFSVRLYDVDAAGLADLVAEDEQQFVTALSATPIEFRLNIAGLVVHQHHTLRLEVFVQTANAAVALDYGGQTPSALTHFVTRWLDSDGDGVADSDEAALGRNPLNANDPVDTIDEGRDSDGDGLADRTEGTLGTRADRVDTDGDGYGDGVEVHAGSNPRDAASRPYDVNQNGLPDSFETNYFSNTTVTPSTGPCTPGPGCIDPFADPDGDGCSNLCEAANGTDPNVADTDGDGVEDGDELDDRTDPASARSVHGPSGPPEPVATAAFFAVGSTLCLVPLLRRP